MPAFSLTDTICALATPPTHAPRAIIRVSGPAAFSSLPLGGRAGEGLASDSLRRALVITLSIPNASNTALLELPALLLCFPAPHSYTGEHCAELCFTGNPFLAERIINALTAHSGVRRAQPGEFTARAFLNGRLSLAQAEGVAATIAARTSEQLAAAQSLLSGVTGDRYRHWADDCTTLLALVEAGIDFTDQEDVVAITAPSLSARALALAADIDALLGARAGAESPRTLPTVVLAGAPNAGKSTLFNALLGKDRAVASPAAGTTRDVLTEPLDLSADAPGAGSVLLQDLAGLSASPTGAIDALAQAHAREAIARADLILWCDPTGTFPEHASPARTIQGRTPALLRVRTFGDQPALSESEAIAVCALDRWNLATLRRAIADHACTTRSADLATLLPRHHRALASASDALRAAAANAAAPELAATNLRSALDELAQLVGAITPDDVIGRVFATFCVGK
ncbi:MAG TPA: GTPase [Phycisphaerales bacterium]|nr:GTPase [Phycisphaerales bacterium]